MAIINRIFFTFIQFAQQKETLLSHFIATATNYICRYETNWYHCQENIGKNFSFRIVFLVGKFNPHFYVSVRRRKIVMIAKGFTEQPHVSKP